jgi:predicted phosphodiesterase
VDNDYTTGEKQSFPLNTHHEIRFEENGKRVLLVQGSPRRMNEYLFEDRALSSFRRLAASSNPDVIVYGHTHQPYTKLVDGVLFVNVGSVGRPKDGAGAPAIRYCNPPLRIPCNSFDVSTS